MMKDCNKKEKCCGVSKVVIPAALGDENGEYRPQNGAYSNTLVEYQASGVSYLYSNDGISTRMGDGIVATIEVGETTTLQPGESATVENTGDKYHAVLNFGIPEGEKGDTGDAATIEVGTTATSAPGSDASVTNSGDAHNAVLDFVIPRGSQGPQGVPGQAATVEVGTVTTLDPDQDATVVNSGTTSAAVFDFGIPKGDKGDTGSVSSEVVTELPVPGDDSKLYLMEKNLTVETADGAAFTIQNAATDGEMRLVGVYGNATQNGTPTPDSPVPVEVVTGENVVKIEGKNLLPMIDGTATIRGITATIADGVLTLNGTSTGSGIIKLTNGVEGATSLAPSASWLTEKLPIANLNGTNIAIDYQSGTSPQASSAFRLYGSTSTYIKQWYPLTSGQATIWTSDTQAPSCLCFFFSNGVTFNNYKITLQIERGSSASSFEPYQGREFPIDLGSIELAKIGTYQDRIYKDDGKWYIEKQTGKVVLDGTETWDGLETLTNTTGAFTRYDGILQNTPCLSNYFVQRTTYLDDTVGISCRPYTVSLISLRFSPSTLSAQTIAGIKTWLASNPTTVYYALATPTTTEITNSTLLAQLNFIANLYGGTNNIMLVGTGAQGEIAVEYQTWEKYNRYDVYIWNDQIGDYQILNS